MAKSADLREQGFFSIDNILETVIIIYRIRDKDKRLIANIRREIQRYMKDKPFEQPIKQRGSTHYFKQDVIDEMLCDKAMINYFEKTSGHSRSYKTNLELAYERQSELKEVEKVLSEKWEKVGLTEEEGKQLEIDKITQKEYLTVDELLFLNLKGLVLRSSLSEEEKSLLAWYHQQEAADEAETKQVEELFYRKKLEIMITALFEQYFTLDERKLKNDINNYVRGGESSVIVTYDGSINNNLPEQTVTRSNLRLQNNKNYYKKREK